MPLSAVLALALGALCAFAVACGDAGNLLTERRADRLTGDIDRVEAAVREGDCEATAVRLQELEAELAEVPQSVSAALRERLAEGVAQLARQATEECQGQRTETLEETVEQPPPPVETQETEPPAETETETEPETPAETETEPEAPAETTPAEPAPDPAEPVEPEGDAGTGGVGEGDGTVP
jgi:hypothetical protein